MNTSLKTIDNTLAHQANLLNALLLEDNEIDSMLISRMLKKNPKIDTYIRANSLKDARNILESGDIDFLISDFYLPDGEGLDFIKESSLPSILMTASNDELVVAQSKSAGVSEFVIKDFHGDYIEHLKIAIDKIEKNMVETEQFQSIQNELEVIMDNASDLIQSADMDGRFLFANRQWFTTLGYQPHQLKDLTLFDVIHTDSHEHCNNLLKKIDATCCYANEPITLVTALGERIFTEANISCRTDKKGNTVSTQAIFRNLTGQLDLKKRLSEGELRFQKLVESAGDTIFQMDERGRTQFVNSVGEKLTGYTAEELKKLTYLDLIYEEDKDKVNRFYTNQFEHLIEFTYLEYRMLRKTGDIKWVGQTITLFMDEHDPTKITGFLGIVRDIHKSKLTERELTAYRNSLEEKVAERTKEIESVKNDLLKVFDSVHDGILILDPQTFTVIETNSRALEIFGYTLSEFQNISLKHLYENDLIQSVIDTSSVEFECKKKDGSIVKTKVNFNTIDFRNETALLMTIQDITEERRMEEHLQNEKKKRFASVVKAQEMERKTFANVLHEDVNQLLAAQNHMLKAIIRGDQIDESVKGGINEILTANSIVLDKIKSLSKSIMPPTLADFGIESAVNNLIETYKKNDSSFEAKFRCPTKVPRISPEAEIGLYRIIDESIQLAKYEAKAEFLNIDIDASDEVIVARIFFYGNLKNLRYNESKIEIIEERAAIIGANFIFDWSENKGSAITISVPHEHKNHIS